VAPAPSAAAAEDEATAALAPAAATVDDEATAAPAPAAATAAEDVAAATPTLNPPAETHVTSMPPGAVELSAKHLPECKGSPQVCAKKLRSHMIAEYRKSKKAGGGADAVQAQAWLNLGNFHWWAYCKCSGQSVRGGVVHRDHVNH
jgi:hypothetical protein